MSESADPRDELILALSLRRICRFTCPVWVICVGIGPFVLDACGDRTPTGGGKPSPGSVAWRAGTIRSPLSAGSLAVDSVHVYVYRSGLAISAVRLSDRSIAWTAASDETFDNGAPLRGTARCGGQVIFGSAGGALYAVSPDDGHREWRWVPSFGGDLGYGAPICDAGRVYVSTGRPMYVYAVDAASGRQLWAVNLSRTTPGTGFVATPRISDGVIVGCTREFTDTISGMIAGVDANSGAVLWRHTWTPEAPTRDASCSVSVAAANGIAVGAADDGRVFGLDLRTGALRWTAPKISGYVTGRDERPVWIVDGVVMVGSLSGVVTGLDLQTGTERWKSVDTDRVISTIIDPSLSGDRGQFTGANTSGQILSFDATTGRRLWTTTPSGKLNEKLLFGPGVLTRDLLIAVASDGLYAIWR